ncbi:MAG: hypothetical protein AAF564_24640 [Bacteroidota bacterium]
MAPGDHVDPVFVVKHSRAASAISRLPEISQNGTSLHFSADTLRALIIFTRFKDDNVAGDPNVAYRDWPLFDNPNQLPAFAKSLLAPDPAPPFADSSLTAYLYEQSLGKYVMYGTAYDSVLISDHPETRYHRSQGGYGLLTKELLDKLDRYGFDFSQYDKNKDGYIDYLFVILRGDSARDKKQFVWTGASCLDARCSGSVAGGGPRELPLYDGIKIDWNLSGSYIIHRTQGNIIPLIYHVRLMAHELGHDLWREHFVHIPALQQNDVPRSHNRGRGKDCIGYMLMAGAGGAQDCQGAQTISAYERDLLDWIDCKVLSTSANNLELGDLYTTSDCYKVSLEARPMGRRLYLSNLQRVGYFDQLRRGGINEQFDMGLLRTTGLLATYARGYSADILPADNTLQLVIDNKAYEGDLFGPGTATQLTPWTRPNSSGYNRYAGDVIHTWIAVDNIRYDVQDTTRMLFDFHEDFRQQPIIREDSWLGEGLADFTFDTPITVTNNSVLTIEKEVRVADALLLDRNTAIHVAEGATLHLLSSSRLQMLGSTRITVAGTFVMDGLVQRSLHTPIERVGDGIIKSNLVD